MNSETELTSAEQSELLALITTRSYTVLDKVMQQEVLKFREDLINTPTTDTNKVLANHQMAKAAAMFYGRLTDRIRRESEMTKLDVVIEPFTDASDELMNVEGI